MRSGKKCGRGGLAAILAEQVLPDRNYVTIRCATRPKSNLPDVNSREPPEDPDRCRWSCRASTLRGALERRRYWDYEQ